MSQPVGNLSQRSESAAIRVKYPGKRLESVISLSDLCQRSGSEIPGIRVSDPSQRSESAVLRLVMKWQ